MREKIENQLNSQVRLAINGMKENLVADIIKTYKNDIEKRDKLREKFRSLFPQEAKEVEQYVTVIDKRRT